MRDPRCVLLFSQHLPTERNSFDGVFVYDQAAALKEVVPEVAVIRMRSRSGGTLVSITHEPPAEWDQAVPTLLVEYRAGVSILNYAVRTLAVLRVIGHFRRRGAPPDLLHLHWWRPALPILMAGRLSRLPVVITEHGSHWPRRTMSGRSLFEARLAVRLADRVIPVSQWLSDLMKDQGARGQLHVVPNMIDTSLFFPGSPSDSNVPLVITVARLDPASRKGVDDIIRALALVLEAGHPCRLLVFGGGSGRQELEALAATEGVGDAVIFRGAATRAAIADTLRHAHLFVSATQLSETFGVAVAEALACGVPVVATDVGAIPELVTDEVGLLVPASDPHALADAMVASLSRSWDREAIAAEATKYGRDEVREQLLAVYRMLLA